VAHLRRRDAGLRTALEANEICIHPMVIGELTCANLRNRTILAHLQLLPQATVATHDEVLATIEQHKFMGHGIGFVDVHLLASAKLSKASLWTRDKRLAAIAEEFGVNTVARGPH
jgi:predicted nucleic acid-binding protein